MISNYDRNRTGENIAVFPAVIFGFWPATEKMYLLSHQRTDTQVRSNISNRKSLGESKKKVGTKRKKRFAT